MHKMLPLNCSCRWSTAVSVDSDCVSQTLKRCVTMSTNHDVCNMEENSLALNGIGWPTFASFKLAVLGPRSLTIKFGRSVSLTWHTSLCKLHLFAPHLPFKGRTLKSFCTYAFLSWLHVISCNCFDNCWEQSLQSVYLVKTSC